MHLQLTSKGSVSVSELDDMADDTASPLTSTHLQHDAVGGGKVAEGGRHGQRQRVALHTGCNHRESEPYDATDHILSESKLNDVRVCPHLHSYTRLVL